MELELTDDDYRIEWDGDDHYRAIFQVTARTEGGPEETVGSSADPSFDDEDEATRFAERFREELAGG